MTTLWKANAFTVLFGCILAVLLRAAAHPFPMGSDDRIIEKNLSKPLQDFLQTGDNHTEENPRTRDEPMVGMGYPPQAYYRNDSKETETLAKPTFGMGSPQRAEMNPILGPLTLATDYIAIGYDYLKGNPDGDFASGGLDRGLKLSRRVFKFTYDNNDRTIYNGVVSSLPDQVAFQATASCEAKETSYAYSGTSSYQRKLDFSIKAEGI